MAKNIYYDPLLTPKQNAMLMRADIVTGQLEENGKHARDIEAARAAKKSKGGFFKRLFGKKRAR